MINLSSGKSTSKLYFMSRYEMLINKQKGWSEGTRGLGEFDFSDFLNIYEVELDLPYPSSSSLPQCSRPVLLTPPLQFICAKSLIILDFRCCIQKSPCTTQGVRPPQAQNFAIFPAELLKFLLV